MRAYVLKHYGGPEGSLLMDVPAPAPGPRDILVAVRAAGLNPVDFKFRQGKLRAILASGWAAPQPANQVPVEHLFCAYIGQFACQAQAGDKYHGFR